MSLLIPRDRWRAPASNKPPSWANVRCPGCGIEGRLTKEIHTVAADGTVTPSYVCPHDPCTFHEWVRLEGWAERPTQPGGSA